MIETLVDSFDIWGTAQTQKSLGKKAGIDNISLHGINRLRELILELAIRGKLTLQDFNDESATILLDKIKKEKKKLISEGEIKKTKQLPEITKEEIPFTLPKGWIFAHLNDLGDWGAGATPLRNKTEYYNGKIPWFKSGELSADYISESEEFVTELALKETSLRYNKPGDVLIAMYGATIGKTSILKVPGTTNQAVCACTPFTGFANTFLLTLLKAYKNRFIEMGAGGAQPNISREKIIATIIALPPLPEQLRIVAKVDELMALCDKLEQQQMNHIETHLKLVEALLQTLTNATNAEELKAAWQHLEPHFDILFTTEESIDLLKQTILQLAVMGKLVPQNPNDEPASELLKKIEAEKKKLIAEGKLKKKKPLPEITEEEKLFELPEGWEWSRLGFISEIKGGKRLPKGHSFSPYETPYIYIQVTNMKNGTIIDNDIKYITEQTKREISNYIISKDDLYITIAGTIGGVGIVPKYFDGMNLTENAAKICFYQVDKEWLQKTLSAKYIQEQFTEKTNQLAQPKLALHRIASSCLAVPPLEEQFRIIAKVDELMSLCDQLKERIIATQELKVKLADAVVAGAVI